MLGWVYVMATCQDGAYKIGFTRRTPRERAAELERDPRYHSFGPFTVELAMPCSWPDTVERNIHRMLLDRRVFGEVFRVDLETAKNIVKAASQPIGPRPAHNPPRSLPERSPRAIRARYLPSKTRWKLQALTILVGASACIVWAFG